MLVKRRSGQAGNPQVAGIQTESKFSHLGLKYEDSKISDLKLAEQSSHIDLILGGHTHTFLDDPLIVKNSIQKNMLIAQVGWGGIKLGRIDFLFEKRTQKIRHSASTIKITTKSS